MAKTYTFTYRDKVRKVKIKRTVSIEKIAAIVETVCDLVTGVDEQTGRCDYRPYLLEFALQANLLQVYSDLGNTGRDELFDMLCTTELADELYQTINPIQLQIIESSVRNKLEFMLNRYQNDFNLLAGDLRGYLAKGLEQALAERADRAADATSCSE